MSSRNGSRNPGAGVFENSVRNTFSANGSYDCWLSPQKAAEFLDVSVKFIYESIAKNEIQSVKVGGRLRRIRLSHLEAWLNGNS